tara:strand:+ start:1380 stop:1514 length:135 start_codon:yes stop_codon:yes gene_type:complete
MFHEAKMNLNEVSLIGRMFEHESAVDFEYVWLISVAKTLKTKGV